MRRYQLYLFEEKKLAPHSVLVRMCALRFLYLKVLQRPFRRDDLPLPKTPKHLPVVLSPEEVERLIEGAANLRHRTILMTLYSTGMRCAELAHLRCEDIDKERMVVSIRQGKGRKDREVPLSPIPWDPTTQKGARRLSRTVLGVYWVRRQCPAKAIISR